MGYELSYSSGDTARKELIIGVAGQSFYEPMESLTKCLNKKIGNVRFKVVSASTYNDFLENEKKGLYDIVFTNGLDAIDLQKQGFRIVAKYGNDETYRSLIFVNKKSSIFIVDDLKGKKMLLSAKKSVLGDLMPVYFLEKNGINVGTDLDTIYSPSFETTIMNVYIGKADAGAVWKTMWDKYLKSHPYIMKRVKVKWETKPLINIAVLVKKGVDQRIVDSLVNAMLGMQEDSDGMDMLKQMQITNFERADSLSYEPMLEFKREYEQMTKR